MISSMRDVNSLSLLDWVAITIRWVLLVSGSLLLAVRVGLSTPVLITLIVAGLVNVIATALVALNQFKIGYRTTSVVIDLLVAYLLFYWNKSIYLELSWIGLLPLASASLYFQWVGAILVTLVNLGVQGWIVWEAASSRDVFILLAVLLPLYLFVGLGLAFFSEHLAKGRRGVPRSRVMAQSEVNGVDRERRRAIYDLVSALSASLNYQKVLETALDLTGDTLVKFNAPADTLVSAVLFFVGEGRKAPELQVVASRRLILSDTRVTIPGIRGLIGQAIDEGVPRLSKTISKDPELSRFVALHRCRSAYCLPLRRGLDAYGIMLFAHPDTEFFTPDRREILDIVGNQAMIALQNARLYQDLDQEKERVMEIQEEARKKMARDLHDGPTQSVSAIAMRVNFARRLMERDPNAAAEELYKIEELARRTTKEIRHMLFTLRPLVLESQGLAPALESMATKMKETYDQNVIVQVDPRVVDSLEVGKQAVVFYISEEAVNNARKHARAAHIWVRLKMLRDGLSLLEIEDDGVGFSVDNVDSSYASRGSLGMVNMRERTELLNGVLRVESAEGRGTRVQVIIPLTDEAADRIRQTM
jgi:signal transduction histidine kinase